MFDYEAIIERVYEHNYSQLNTWESKFIADIYEKKCLDNLELSQVQKDKILQINRKVLKG